MHYVGTFQAVQNITTAYLWSQLLEPYQAVTLPVLHVIEATRPWTGVSASFAKDTSKKLVCPADYSDRFKGAGYKTTAEALQAFNDLGCLLEDVKASLAWTMVMDWSKHSLAGEQNSTQHAVSDLTKMKFKVLLNGRCMQMMKLPLQRRNNSPLKNYSEKMTP